MASGAESENANGLSRVGSRFRRVHVFKHATAPNATTASLEPVAVVHGITDAVHFAVLIGARANRLDRDGLCCLGRVGRSSYSDNRSESEGKELHGEYAGKWTRWLKRIEEWTHS